MIQHAGYHTYYVYIIANQAKTVLHTGVTDNLRARVQRHKENMAVEMAAFDLKYKISYLLYYEKFSWIQEAVAREKEIKNWPRKKKIGLIKTMNPEFEFLNFIFEFPSPTG